MKSHSKSAAVMREWLKTDAGLVYKERHREYQKQWRAANEEKYNRSRAKCESDVRLEALQHYSESPPKCAECGCKTIKQLRISPLTVGLSVYMLRAQGWPEGHRVLCFPCVCKQRGEWTKKNRPGVDPATGLSKNYQREFVACSQCLQPILRRRCHRKASKGAFWCSRTCMAKWKLANAPRGELHPCFVPRVNVKCDHCGTDLIRKRCSLKAHVFCNQKCSYLWKAANLVADKLYNWEGGYDPYYGPSWRNARRAARERDGHTCQRCGKQTTRALDVHHKIPFSKFGAERHEEANALSNLISYCVRCHKTVEEKEKQQCQLQRKSSAPHRRPKPSTS